MQTQLVAPIVNDKQGLEEPSPRTWLTSSTSRPIRVLVIHRMRLWSDLIVGTLAKNCQFDAHSFEGDPVALAVDLKTLEPDVALISTDWDGTNSQPMGIVHSIHSVSPKISTVLLLHASDDPLVVDAFRAGVRGVVDQDDSVELLMRCLQSVYEGQTWAHNGHFHQVVRALSREGTMVAAKDGSADFLLSRREWDVIQCVADGLTNRDIAVRLDLSVHTIKNYLFRLFGRLGVSNRAELVACALGSRRLVAGSAASERRYDA